MVLLQPGESISNHVQVFFTNQGVTFTSPGRHTVVAQLEVDAVTTAVSVPATVDVRMATSEDELSISAKSLTKGVGKALALGDFASDEEARAVLTELAESHADTDTGAASALVMANSLARSFTDYRAERTRRARLVRRSASSTSPSRAGRRHGRSSWRSRWPARPRRMLPWSPTP